MKFIKLPNDLIWSYTGERTLINTYEDKIIHILCYLDINTNRLGITRFSLEEMIKSCGLTPRPGKDDNGKDRTNNQFINILYCLELDGTIADIKGDYKKPKEMINCTLKMPVRDSEFFPLYHDHYIKIMNSKEDKLLLLKIYCYISARLKRKSARDLGEVVECMYCGYETMSNDLNITHRTLHKYLDILHEMKILYFDNIGMVIKNKRTSIANNVYCFKESELVNGLIDSNFYYLKEGYTVIGKKTSKEMKIVNGLKGKIVQQRNAGKDTTRLERIMKRLQKGKKLRAYKQTVTLQEGFTYTNGQPVRYTSNENIIF